MENNSSGSCSSGGGDRQRTPLSRVVSDCVRRWFQETLKEAKAGDLSMQVLVGQMYFNGYGVPQDAHKVKDPFFCSVLLQPITICGCLCRADKRIGRVRLDLKT